MSGVQRSDETGKCEIFLSFHLRDEALARQLYERLTAEGFRVWFCVEAYGPGALWLAAIERALREAQTFLVLLTDSAPQRWVEAEVGAALRRQVSDPEHFRIVPILVMSNGVAPRSLGVFLDAFQRCEVHLNEKQVEPNDLARLIVTLREKTVGLTGLKLVDEPYRGLEVFRTEDQHLFFGRGRETSELVERLQRNRWVQVEGGSGSGKSSLVRAGLMPALTRRLRDVHDADWIFLTMRPGGNPVKALASALLVLEPEQRQLGRLDAMERLLESSPEALANIVREWNQLCQADRPRPVLLLVDQFEELFTQGDRGGLPGGETTGATGNGDIRTINEGSPKSPREQFIALLHGALADRDGMLRLVTTIRSDFLHLLTQHEVLARALNGAERYALGPHVALELRHCILEPLRMAGGRVAADELVQRMIDDTEAGPGRLPLLSHALRALWHAALKRGEFAPTLRFEDYEAIGGVGGAVTQSADDLLSSLSPTQQQAARRMFLELVQVRRGVRDVRKSCSRATLLSSGGAEAEYVLLRLSGGTAAQPGIPAPPRLLVADRAVGATRDAETVDLIHDALVERWTTLRGWLDQARRDLERRDDLMAAAAAWANAGSRSGDLPGPGLLVYYTKWNGEPLPISATAQEYMTAARRRHKTQRQLTIASLAGAVVAAVVFAVLSVWAMQQRQTALKQLSRADLSTKEAKNLAVQEQASRDKAEAHLYFSSIGLADSKWHANRVDQTLSLLAACPPERRDWEWRYLRRRCQAGFELASIPGVPGDAECLALSPKGDLIATAKGKTIFLWQLKGDSKNVSQIAGHAGEIKYMVFYPDGLRLASLAEVKGAGDKTSGELKVWDLGTRRELFTVATRGTGMPDSGSLAFGEDGQSIVVPDLNIAHIYDEKGTRILTVPPRPVLVSAVALSMSHKVLAVAGAKAGKEGYEGAVVYLWSLKDGQIIHTLNVNTTFVQRVVFSADGKRLATSGDDNEICVWDVDSGEQLAIHGDHTQSIVGLAFLANTEMIVSAAADRTLRVWIWKTARGAVATQGTGVVRFPTDVKTLVTATDGTWLAADSEGHVYHWKGDLQDCTKLQDHRRPIFCLVFNADGSRLATRSFDGTLKILDTKTRKGILTAESKGTGTLCAAFSPDGRWLAVNHNGDGEADTEVTLLNTEDGKAAFHWPAGREAISHLAFSPDGLTLACVAEEARAVTFWIVQAKSQKQAVQTHPREAEPIVAVAYSPDGRLFATAISKGVAIWNPRTGEIVRRLPDGDSKVVDVAFSTDGQRLACAVIGASGERLLKVHEVGTGERLANWESQEFEFHSGALNRRGTRMVVAARDEEIKIVETRTGREVLALPRWGDNRLAVFSPDGHLLAAVAESSEILGSSSVRLFDGSPLEAAGQQPTK